MTSGQKYLFLLGIVIIGVVGAMVVYQSKKTEGGLQGSAGSQRSSYDLIGTPTASSTLTALYTGNSKVLLTSYLENLHLDVRYSPHSGQTNKYAEVLIEGSNDGGVNYFPLATKVVGTDEIDMYVTSTADGFPIGIVIPGNKVSVGSTTYQGGIDFDMVADHVRISAREPGATGSTDSGNIYIRGTVTAKQ